MHGWVIQILDYFVLSRRRRELIRLDCVRDRLVVW